jgi:hypothetical protein
VGSSGSSLEIFADFFFSKKSPESFLNFFFWYMRCETNKQTDSKLPSAAIGLQASVSYLFPQLAHSHPSLLSPVGRDPGDHTPYYYCPRNSHRRATTFKFYVANVI